MKEREPRRRRVSLKNNKLSSGAAGSAAAAKVMITSNKPMIGLFERQIEALGAAPFALSFHEIFEVLVTHAAPEADKACRAFAKTLQWPSEMSERVRLGVCLRLECAREYCKRMAKNEERDEPLRERQDEFIKELLIEYWYEAGREEWFMKEICPVNNDAYKQLMKESLHSMIWKDVTRRN